MKCLIYKNVHVKKGKVLNVNFSHPFLFYPSITLLFKTFLSVIVETEPVVIVLLLIHDTDYMKVSLKTHILSTELLSSRVAFGNKRRYFFVVFLIIKSFKFFLCFFLNINYINSMPIILVSRCCMHDQIYFCFVPGL